MAFSFKYFALPLVVTKLAGIYFSKDVEKSFKIMAEKYNFGYLQYNQAMDIMERANRVGKLEQLLE